jgi:flagellum-specific peptidoglycan hydrolase FlgJ
MRSKQSRGRGRHAGRRASTRLRAGLVLGVGGLALLAAAGMNGAAARPTRAPTRPTVAQAEFIDRVGHVAQWRHTTVGLPPSLITAMAINETGWGSSELSARANNYFGIKAQVGDGTLGSVEYETREVVDGQAITVRAPFRVYRSLEESVDDLGLFLHANPRYDSLWARSDDPRASARALAQAGYATDPAWSIKLIALIDAFGLEALDPPGWLPDWLHMVSTRPG